MALYKDYGPYQSKQDVLNQVDELLEESIANGYFSVELLPNYTSSSSFDVTICRWRTAHDDIANHQTEP